MRKEMIKSFLFFLFPILFTILFLVANHVMQPNALKTDSSYKTTVLEEMDTEKLYALEGEITCYPKALLAPNTITSYRGKKKTIHSITEIKDAEYIVGDNYVATIKLQIKVPAENEYEVILPGHFCTYTVFSNGKLCASSQTYKYKNPVYPTPKYISLPYSDSGYYSLVINLTTPINCQAGSYGANLFGTVARISQVQKMEKTIVYSILSFVIFIISACLIQMLSFRNDKVLNSFLFLVITALFRVLFSDNVIAVELFKGMPYQLGTVARIISVPLFMFAMMFHIRTIYRKYFSNRLLIIGSISLLIPLISDLTMSKLPVFGILSILCLFIPYAICYYVLFIAAKDGFFYSSAIILGLTSLFSGSVVDIITLQNTIPGKYTYTYGVIFLSVAQLITLAHTYAQQDNAEISMTEELKKQMEAMQASENAFLNAQMKPHFLYNTLNTIADLCVTDSDKARSLISSLKDYVAMVISLDNMEETVSLSQELKLARTYYKIEKERFPSIEFFEELPIRIPNIQMPPLVLQPLVENAIKHGVRKSTRPGVIIIRIKEKPDNVMFQVSDNGAGMTQENIEKMFVVPRENKSVGIYNINKRLKNLYGSGLTVESTVDLGTCISFTIPKGNSAENIKHGSKRSNS